MADYGLSFRDTSAYRTNTGVNSWVPYSFFSANYPQTLANGITVGWETAPSGVDARDRSTSNDERLAGFHFPQNAPSSLTIFRADLPATGAYDIRAAMGDAIGSPPYAYMEILDTSSSLGVVVNDSAGYSTDEFYDATGVKRTSSADWVSNNASVSKTFSTTIARFKMQPGGAVAGSTRLSYIRITTAAASGSTGTLAKTNANDTSAASGTTTLQGSLAKTNANDTLAASGTTTITGTLAKTNANDTLAASGSVGSPVTGTVATTNANDTLSSAGTTKVQGSLAKTNVNDVSAASGTTTITGTLAKTNANDTLAASGASGSAVSGSIAYTNANDTLAASGTTKVLGSSATTNANDSLTATGTTKIVGTLAKTNANDTLTASGVAGIVSGTLATTNANDAVVATGDAGVPTTSVWLGGAGPLPRQRTKKEEDEEVKQERIRRGIIPPELKHVAEISAILKAPSPKSKVYEKYEPRFYANSSQELKAKIKLGVDEGLKEMRRLRQEDDETAMKYIMELV